MDKTNKKTILVDIALVSLVYYLAFVGKAGYVKPTFCFLIGSIFIFSKKFKGLSYVYRSFYWIAMNIFKPKTIYNHIIWGIFFLVFGLFDLFFVNVKYPRDNFLIEIEKTTEFWIGVILILIFNIAVGLYTAYRRNLEE